MQRAVVVCNVVVYLVRLASTMVSCPTGDFDVAGKMLAIEDYPNFDFKADTFEGVHMAMPKLEVLILRNDSIDFIRQSTFSALRSLKCLDLSRNNLVALQAGAFSGLRNLKTLILNMNELSSIDPLAFESLDSLEIIDLSKNELSHLLSGQFVHLPQLRALHLEHNRLESVTQYAWNGMLFLEYLLMNGNPLSQASISNLHQLKMLSVAFTELRRIPALPANSTLLAIDMDSSHISTIFPYEIIELKHLQAISMRNTPLSCNCSMAQFAIWGLQTQSKGIQHPHETLCLSPAVYSGQTLASVLRKLLISCTNDSFVVDLLRHASTTEGLMFPTIGSAMLSTTQNNGKRLKPAFANFDGPTPSQTTTSLSADRNDDVMKAVGTPDELVLLSWQGIVLWVAIGLITGLVAFLIYYCCRKDKHRELEPESSSFRKHLCCRKRHPVVHPVRRTSSTNLNSRLSDGAVERLAGVSSPTGSDHPILDGSGQIIPDTPRNILSSTRSRTREQLASYISTAEIPPGMYSASRCIKVTTSSRPMPEFTVREPSMEASGSEIVV